MPARSYVSRFAFLGALVHYLRARRALIPFAGSVAYVVLVGAREDHGSSGRPWLFGLPALVCAFTAASPRLPGNGLTDDGRRQVGLVAYALWALGLVLASLDAVETDAWHDLCGGIGAFASSLTAAQAIARIRGGEGMGRSLPKPPRSLEVATLFLLTTAFGLAVVASARVLADPESTTSGAADALALAAHVHALAAGGALLILAASGWETLRLKRLVLEAGDRALTALLVVVATSAVAAGLLLLGEGAPDRILRAAVAVAAVLVTITCTEGDAETLARRGRRAVSLVLFGGPVVLLGALAAQGPGRSTMALLVTGLAALAVGSAIAYLELPLRRADGHLLDAVETATSALLRADPDTSVRDALAALRALGGLTNESPELWSLAPARVLTIDAAGYPHERDARLPERLLEVAEQEPEATLRTELLLALVVRRPDLRSLARWMDERGALSATVVTREGEAQGLLVLPRGPRSVPLSLEEVRAIRRLADAFAGAAAAHAALERSLERERALARRAGETEGQLAARERIERWMSEHDRLATSRLAESAAGGPYSPGARLAFEAMVQRAERSQAVVVLAPMGSDVVPYLARAHLAGPRRQAPFVIVDGATLAHHDLARWLDPTASPLVLADRGALVLVDGVRLPHPVQGVIADAIAQKRAPWSGTDPLDIVPLVIAREAPQFYPLMTALLLEPLAEPIVWPRLSERGEDLRSMVLAILGREGMCVRGAPLGIDDAAYAKLADHPYRGEEAELRSILQRLALVAKGDVVRAEDVTKLGLA